jgi:serine/threonine-protein kinase
MFYYVMELVDGLSGDDAVRRFGALEPARAVYVLRQACHALGEAHAAGLVHRDVKPSNLFICNLGGQADFVKVFDFGLVRSVRSPDDRGIGAGPAGTPAFIAPEASLAPDRVVDAALGACPETTGWSAQRARRWWSAHRPTSTDPPARGDESGGELEPRFD